MSADLTSMRWHELALQRWLSANFFVAEGYPIPVVFSSPMDAFAHFNQLWASAQNPFSYLLEAKDEQGQPLYQPHPQPARYPLIGISRRGSAMRAAQTYSIHRYRHLGWPTYSDNATRNDYGRVRTARMPMAWNYRFQLDFFSLRPDTQAEFAQAFMSKFWMTGGGTPRCFVKVSYPGYFGDQFVQLLLDGGTIEQTTPDEPGPADVVEYRLTANLTLEGWVPDLAVVEYPALWLMTTNAWFQGESEPFLSKTVDLRTGVQVPSTVPVIASFDIQCLEDGTPHRVSVKNWQQSYILNVEQQTAPQPVNAITSFLMKADDGSTRRVRLRLWQGVYVLTPDQPAP